MAAVSILPGKNVVNARSFMAVRLAGERVPAVKDDTVAGYGKAAGIGLVAACSERGGL